jgi:hypothetical protein
MKEISTSGNEGKASRKGLSWLSWPKAGWWRSLLEVDEENLRYADQRAQNIRYISDR